MADAVGSSDQADWLEFRFEVVKRGRSTEFYPMRLHLEVDLGRKIPWHVEMMSTDVDLSFNQR